MKSLTDHPVIKLRTDLFLLCFLVLCASVSVSQAQSEDFSETLKAGEGS